jgi:hypothetical protein
MAMTTNGMYSLDLDQSVDLIAAIGHKRMVLLEGDMGNGKTSTLKTLAKRFPTHKAILFNCPDKDVQDLQCPSFQTMDTNGFVRFVPHEELGLHLGGPVIICIDEVGKALDGVARALRAFWLERRLGSYDLHPDSIIYATTNFGAEGLGDFLEAHQMNALTWIELKKWTNIQWIGWGINNDIDHGVLSAAKDNPQWFHSFRDVPNPEDNPHIFHPKEYRKGFVTPRSLEAASDLAKIRHLIDDQTFTASLIGTIGMRTAMDLATHLKLADQLPTLDSIKNDPRNAIVPTSAAAKCMIVFRTLAVIEKEWINNWMDYLVRLDREAQGMFANGVRAPKYTKQAMVMTNRKFTEWAVANNYMFHGDKV